jgi:hypothetical protein
MSSYLEYSEETEVKSESTNSDPVELYLQPSPQDQLVHRRTCFEALPLVHNADIKI